MTLVNPLPFIKKAQVEKKAIPAFNIHTMEMIQAVVEVAAEEKSPVIVQTTPGTIRHAGIPYLVAAVKTAAEVHGIPVALHLDHCPSYETVIKCIKHGYTSVMVDGSMLPYEKNVALVSEVVKVATPAGVAVEGEIGQIGGTEDEIDVKEEEAGLTGPKEALQFAEESGVDTLAVAIGTAHGEYQGQPHIDFDRLSAIQKLVDIPLVLHGASGVSAADISKSIERGMTKVNIATDLKIPMAEAVKKYFAENPGGNDPRKYLGAGKEAVKKVVRKKIELCRSAGMLAEMRY